MSAAPDIDWTDIDAAPAAEPAPTRQHDHQAERHVLGAALLNPDLIPELAGLIGDQDWHLPAHETIWAALTDRHATGQPIDPALLAHDVGTHRTLTAHGGPLYLHTLIADPGLTVSNAPWHARTVAEQARQRRWTVLGTWMQQAITSGADEAEIRQRVEKHLAERNPADKVTTSSWAPVDLTEVLAGTAPDDRPTMLPRSDGLCLLYPGVNVLQGEPTSGKTFLALHAVLHELRAGHHAAIVDFEDRATRVTARLLAIGATPDQLRDQLRYIRPDTALDTPGRDALSRAVTGTTLVILDGVTEAMTMHGLDLSSNPDVATFYALLPRWIAAHGPTVVLIDHVVKDGEKQGRWSIGGQHKVAGIDGAAYTVKNVIPLGRGKAGHSRVFIAKDRHGHVEEHALGRCAAEFHLDSTDPDASRSRLDPPEAMPTSETTGDSRPTILMEKVSRWLEINPDSTGKAIDEAKLGKATYVRKALQTLVAEGYVTTVTGLRGAVHHHSLEPYRRDQEDTGDATH